MATLRCWRGSVINVTLWINLSPQFSLKLRRKESDSQGWKARSWRENICRKDFAMGKGKSIYSGNVLGNRRGREWEKNGFRKDFTNVQGKQTKQRTRNGAGSGASKLAGWFSNRNPLAYCWLKDISYKKTRSKAIGPHDKANYSNSNGSYAITLYSSENDD